MKLSERIRNADAGTFQDMWNEIADEVAQLEAENNELIAAVAGMRDKWTPPDEVAQLEAENEALKTELRGERERLLIEMYNNDTISQVQFDHAMNELALLEASK